MIIVSRLKGSACALREIKHDLVSSIALFRSDCKAQQQHRQQLLERPGGTLPSFRLSWFGYWLIRAAIAKMTSGYRHILTVRQYALYSPACSVCLGVLSIVGSPPSIRDTSTCWNKSSICVISETPHAHTHDVNTGLQHWLSGCK